MLGESGVVVAPQLAYTLANCSRGTAQAKRKGLLRPSRAFVCSLSVLRLFVIVPVNLWGDSFTRGG